MNEENIDTYTEATDEEVQEICSSLCDEYFMVLEWLAQ